MRAGGTAPSYSVIICGWWEVAIKKRERWTFVKIKTREYYLPRLKQYVALSFAHVDGQCSSPFVSHL